MLESDRVATCERYRRRCEEFGYDCRTLGWNKDCQWVRFEAALESLRPEDIESVLDVGCGFGDLLGFLRERGWRGQYTGVDIVEDLLDVAQRAYAGDSAARFLLGEVGELGPEMKSGLVVALGVFNHRVEQGNPAFVRETFEAMWKISERVVVCDFLSTSSDPQCRDERLYYADPVAIYHLGAQYSKRVIIHHAYMPFEFQMKVWHDDSFDAAAPVFPPQRQLARAQTEWRKKRRLD
jgi:SAM-dependent methyltransferase